LTITRTKQREDAGQQRVLPVAIKQALTQQYNAHKGWSYQLHVDNLLALTEQDSELEGALSYSTVRRYMKSQGMTKMRRVKTQQTAG